ncbi:DUF4190 domain-containing protein [Actinomadura gamaensis]|uniref:DUF4190 domain-containing protein n=1 Tax=Actinomadura gamaensis TaxID=1763541 RepID=A0ABV9TZT6_9ACTN
MAQPPYDPYGGYGQQHDPYAAQQPPPYAQPAPVQHNYYGAPAAQSTNGMATASMVLGLVGIFFCGFTSVLAIIFGHIAHSQIKRTGEGGSGMATAGLVLGYIVAVGWIIFWIFYIGLWAALVGSSGSSTTY